MAVGVGSDLMVGIILGPLVDVGSACRVGSKIVYRVVVVVEEVVVVVVGLHRRRCSFTSRLA